MGASLRSTVWSSRRLSRGTWVSEATVPTALAMTLEVPPFPKERIFHGEPPLWPPGRGGRDSAAGRHVQSRADGKRVFYPGDFRVHGRRRGRFEEMVADPSGDTDVLLREGTTVGRGGTGEGFASEMQRERAFVSAFRETRDLHCVWNSSQNIDRPVTVFRPDLGVRRPNRHVRRPVSSGASWIGKARHPGSRL